MITTIALSEFQTLRKQKIFILLLMIFLSMALFSTYIGWSAKNTILRIYDEIIKEMGTKDLNAVPSNPFLNTAPLSILKNMVIYVELIGSLLAIIIGSNSFIRERRAGVSKIIFSKPIRRIEFVLGKMLGIFLVLTSIMGVTFAISIFSVALVSAHILPFAEVLKLLFFYGVSLIYMFIFSMIGLYFSIVSKSESMAFLIPIMIWILISFVMPQITSALDPAALLNPTNIQATFPQSHFFTTVQTIIHPFSISENYQIIGKSLLEGNVNEFPMRSSLLFLVILIPGCLHAMYKYNACEEEMSE